MLRDLACPTCGAPGLTAHQPDGVVLCKFCGNKFAEDDRVACPNCEAIHAHATSFCGECGAKLKRTCMACGAENWSGADHCVTCGRNLDSMEAIAERHAEGFKGTLQRQRELANLLKAEEEEAGQKRLDALWDVERRRQETLAQQAAQQRWQQGLMMAMALAGLGVFVAGLGAVAYYMMLR